MRPTTTYEEYIAANPAFVTQMEAAGATTAIQEIIDDEFFNRVICDEQLFGRYFLKRLKRYIPVYTDYVRIEAAKHDFTPMVTRYLLEAIHGDDTPTEYTKTTTPAHTRQTKTPAGSTVTDTPAETTTTHTPAHTKDTVTPAEVTRTVTPAETTITETPAEVTRTTTPAGTTDETTYASDTTRSGSEKTTDTGSTIDTRQIEADSKQLLKTLPMSSSSITTGTGSISQGGASAQQITGLDWTDASQQQQKTDGSYDKLTHDYNGAAHETVYTALKDAKGGKDTTVHTTQTAGTEVDTTQTAGTSASTTQQAGTEVDTTQSPEYIERETIEAGTDAKTTQTAGTRTTVYDTNETIEKETVSGGTESMSISKKGEKNNEHVFVGAEGLTPQEAMRQALDFLREIATSDEMLIEKLEPCFLSVIEI